MVALLKQHYAASPRRVVAKKTGSTNAAPVVHGGFVLDEKQYEHFEKCMQNPAEPTETLKAGARLMRELRAKR